MSSHLIRGRQLSRDTEHRKAMRRNLVQSLFEHGEVRTTLPKAKEVRSMAERLITLARQQTLTARRRVIATLNDRRLVDKDQEFTGQSVVQKLFDEIAPRYAERRGGYSRIVKLEKYRIGDAGSLVLLQLLPEGSSAPHGTVRRSAGLRRKRNERRHQFASQALKKEKESGKAVEEGPQGEAPTGAPAAAPEPENKTE